MLLPGDTIQPLRLWLGLSIDIFMESGATEFLSGSGWADASAMNAMVCLSLFGLGIPFVNNPREILLGEPCATCRPSLRRRSGACVGVSGLALAMLTFEDTVVPSSLQQSSRNPLGASAVGYVMTVRAWSNGSTAMGNV